MMYKVELTVKKCLWKSDPTQGKDYEVIPLYE